MTFWTLPFAEAPLAKGAMIEGTAVLAQSDRALFQAKARTNAPAPSDIVARAIS